HRRPVYHEEPYCRPGPLQQFDTVHGLPWNGPAPVPRYNGLKGVPRPSVGFSGRVHLPTTMRAQAPDPCPGRIMTMRFYTSAHRFYCGVDLHARSMSDVGAPVALTGRPGGTDEFLGRGDRPAAVPALGKR